MSKTGTKRGRGRQTSAATSDLPASLQWAQKYLRDYFTDAPAPFHVELFADLQNPENRLIARIAPRGHAKSTCAALAYPVWCICEQQRRNIVIITYESSLARQFVRDIRTELETNEVILDAYGDLCAGDAPEPKRPRATTKRRKTASDRSTEAPDAAPPVAQQCARRRRKWSEDKFTTSTGVTVQAKGSGASFRGTKVGPQRPDLIICDDIEHDDRVASPDGREKLEHWLRRVVMPALAPGGQLLILGSLIHSDSLLANLRDRRRFPRWDYRVYRALEGEAGPDGQCFLRALWPARWPVARLEEERERIGTLAFEQEYMANPIDDTVRIFRKDWLKRYDPVELDARRDQLVTLMAVDPATGQDNGDFFALWVGSVDPGTGVIYTRALTLERINIVEQVQRIVAAFEQWRPLKVGIETNAYQIALKDVLDDYGRRNGLFIPVVRFNTSVGKIARIQGSSAFYENGRFRLPPTLDPEAEAQFLHFPKGAHDDAPDVCAMGIELAGTIRGGRVETARPRRRNPFTRNGGW